MGTGRAFLPGHDWLSVFVQRTPNLSDILRNAKTKWFEVAHGRHLFAIYDDIPSMGLRFQHVLII